jgi:CRP-like cAMP-binding protein
MKPVLFKAGDTIISEGEDGDTAFLVVSGLVEVSVSNAGKTKTLGTLGPGEIFGEMSLLDPGPRSATVRALGNTECIATSYDEFIASIQEEPQRAAQFMRTLVRRLRQMNERMAGDDPGRRGMRAMFRDWQSSMHELPDDRLPLVHWTFFL